MRYALILSLAVFLVGCFEEPTLTWTTDVELRQSIENVRESLPDSQQAIFMDAIDLYQTANEPVPKPSFDHIEDVVERMEAERNAYDFVAHMLETYPHRQIAIEDLRGKTGEQILEAYSSVIEERDAHVVVVKCFRPPSFELSSRLAQPHSAAVLRYAYAGEGHCNNRSCSPLLTASPRQSTDTRFPAPTLFSGS